MTCRSSCILQPDALHPRLCCPARPRSTEAIRGVVELGAHSLKIHSLRRDEIVTVKYPYALGHEVYTRGTISEQTMRRVLDCMEGHGLRLFLAIGTSAVRDAVNRQQLIDRIWNVLGIPLHILSPWEEASLLAAAYLSCSRDLPALVFDLGGGSLEIVFINRSGAIVWNSLPLGAVRCAYLGTWKDPEEERQIVRREFQSAWIVHSDRVYACGGTAAAVVKSQGSMTVHPGDLIDLEDSVRRHGPPAALHPERARVFLPGLILLREILMFAEARTLLYLKISIGRAYLSLACAHTAEGPHRMPSAAGHPRPLPERSSAPRFAFAQHGA